MTRECGNLDFTIDVREGGGFVSDVTTFLVTDDLRLMPNTSGCIFQLLCDHGITDASQCEKRTFDIDRKQILILLKGALLFKSSLTCLVYPNTRFNLHLVKHRQRTSILPLSCEIGTSSRRMKLKVTLCKSTSNFLFAEADEDFVDFVFGFLESL